MKKFNKRQVLQRILKSPLKQKRNFWAREMKALNDLLEVFDNTEFWRKANFQFKPNSLLFFKTPDGAEILKNKYNEFNYKIPKPKTLALGKTFGENRAYSTKHKTIKSFLGGTNE